MSTILDQIIANKQLEVAERKRLTSISDLEKSGFFAQKCNSLTLSLVHPASSGIISEFKRQSPSKGIIKPNADVQAITKGYVASGAAGLSVLTDSKFFGGSDQDFLAARRANPTIPMIRKDFMIDPFQIVEARSLGADVVLLIAANLSPAKVKELGALAKSLGLETLLEIHNKAELDQTFCQYIDHVGVNNRNLKDFSEETVAASEELYQYLPEHCQKISESCISKPEIVKHLRNIGFNGFLIGESFMKKQNPAEELSSFIVASK